MIFRERESETERKNKKGERERGKERKRGKEREGGKKREGGKEREGKRAYMYTWCNSVLGKTTDINWYRWIRVLPFLSKFPRLFGLHVNRFSSILKSNLIKLLYICRIKIVLMLILSLFTEECLEKSGSDGNYCFLQSLL